MNVNRFVSAVMVILLLVGMLAGCSVENTNSNWKFIVSNILGVFSDEGYYYQTSGGFLYFLDVDNGINVCLCSKIGCKHDTDKTNLAEKCESRIGGKLAFFWDNMLYYVVCNNLGTHLYRRSADGTGQQHVMQLCKEYTDTQKSVENPVCFFADGSLYYIATIYSVTTEGNSSSAAVEQKVLKRVDLNRRTEEELLSVSGQTDIEVEAVCRDGIMYTTWTLPEGTTSENRPEALRASTVYLIHWDLRSGERKTLLEGLWGTFSLSAVSNERIIYSIQEGDSSCLREQNLRTGKDTLLYKVDGLDYLSQDFALRPDNVTNTYILVDAKSGKDLPTEYTGKALYIVDISVSGAILSRSIPMQGTSKNKHVYSFVYFCSLKDGLQEEDLIDFYVRGS